MPQSTTKSATLAVKLTLPASKQGKQADARVYLFDAANRLVHSLPAKESVQFQIDPQQRYRVTVGPDLIQGETAPANLGSRLLGASAISRDYLPENPTTKMSIVATESLVSLWLFVCINIHGTVRKHLIPGNTYAPICTGTVQIFTIDLACSLERLSDAELLNIRNQTLAQMAGVEIADIFSFNIADFVRVSALAAGLSVLTGNALRNYIVTHRADLAPFMCGLIPEWAICYQQLPDAPIQSDGTFSLDYCFLFWETPPDLYFEVLQTLDGATREIADPDIMCTTMWAYDGSQSAQITVEDQSAVACLPPDRPGPAYLYVWPTAIGNIDLRQIDGIETLVGTGLLSGDTPWGGTLPLQMQFDPNLRANNIWYYRWSYKFDGDSQFTQINSSVTHRWQEITNVMGVIHIHLHPVTFGPKMVGGQTNLFEIPDPALTWIDINDPVDRPFAYFDSTAGQNPGRNGMVTLKLEMFDNLGAHVSSGNAMHAGPFKFILPDLMGVGDAYVDAPAPNIDVNGDLIFKVLVDNNHTLAQLPAVHAAGNLADACGILHYSMGSDPVTIDFIATHPNGYLSWGLSVSRGMTGGVASRSGIGNSLVPDHLTRTASALLGSCVQAAFAVNLDTYARATNGYSTQTQYNDHATIAFALLTP